MVQLRLLALIGIYFMGILIESFSCDVHGIGSSISAAAASGSGIDDSKSFSHDRGKRAIAVLVPFEEDDESSEKHHKSKRCWRGRPLQKMKLSALDSEEIENSNGIVKASGSSRGSKYNLIKLYKDEKRSAEEESGEKSFEGGKSSEDNSERRFPYLRIVSLKNPRANSKKLLGLDREIEDETPSNESEENTGDVIFKRIKSHLNSDDYKVLALVGKRANHSPRNRQEKYICYCREDGDCSGRNCPRMMYRPCSSCRNTRPVFTGKANSNYCSYGGRNNYQNSERHSTDDRMPLKIQYPVTRNEFLGYPVNSNAQLKEHPGISSSGNDLNKIDHKNLEQNLPVLQDRRHQFSYGTPRVVLADPSINVKPLDQYRILHVPMSTKSGMESGIPSSGIPQNVYPGAPGRPVSNGHRSQSVKLSADHGSYNQWAVNSYHPWNRDDGVHAQDYNQLYQSNDYRFIGSKDLVANQGIVAFPYSAIPGSHVSKTSDSTQPKMTTNSHSNPGNGFYNRDHEGHRFGWNIPNGLPARAHSQIGGYDASTESNFDSTASLLLATNELQENLSGDSSYGEDSTEENLAHGDDQRNGNYIGVSDEPQRFKIPLISIPTNDPSKDNGSSDNLEGHETLGSSNVHSSTGWAGSSTQRTQELYNMRNSITPASDNTDYPIIEHNSPDPDDHIDYTSDETTFGAQIERPVSKQSDWDEHSVGTTPEGIIQPESNEESEEDTRFLAMEPEHSEFEESNGSYGQSNENQMEAGLQKENVALRDGGRSSAEFIARRGSAEYESVTSEVEDSYELNSSRGKDAVNPNQENVKKAGDGKNLEDYSRSESIESREDVPYTRNSFTDFSMEDSPEVLKENDQESPGDESVERKNNENSYHGVNDEPAVVGIVNSPTKYFSPNDRVLEYIKKHSRNLVGHVDPGKDDEERKQETSSYQTPAGGESQYVTTEIYHTKFNRDESAEQDSQGFNSGSESDETIAQKSRVSDDWNESEDGHSGEQRTLDENVGQEFPRRIDGQFISQADRYEEPRNKKLSHCGGVLPETGSILLGESKDEDFAGESGEGEETSNSIEPSEILATNFNPEGNMEGFKDYEDYDDEDEHPLKGNQHVDKPTEEFHSTEESEAREKFTSTSDGIQVTPDVGEIVIEHHISPGTDIPTEIIGSYKNEGEKSTPIDVLGKIQDPGNFDSEESTKGSILPGNTQEQNVGLNNEKSGITHTKNVFSPHNEDYEDSDERSMSTEESVESSTDYGIKNLTGNKHTQYYGQDNAASLGKTTLSCSHRVAEQKSAKDDALLVGQSRDSSSEEDVNTDSHGERRTQEQTMGLQNEKLGITHIQSRFFPQNHDYEDSTESSMSTEESVESSTDYSITDNLTGNKHTQYYDQDNAASLGRTTSPCSCRVAEQKSPIESNDNDDAVLVGQSQNSSSEEDVNTNSHKERRTQDQTVGLKNEKSGITHIQNRFSPHTENYEDSTESSASTEESVESSTDYSTEDFAANKHTRYYDQDNAASFGRTTSPCSHRVAGQESPIASYDNDDKFLVGQSQDSSSEVNGKLNEHEEGIIPKHFENNYSGSNEMVNTFTVPREQPSDHGRKRTHENISPGMNSFERTALNQYAGIDNQAIQFPNENSKPEDAVDKNKLVLAHVVESEEEDYSNSSDDDNGGYEVVKERHNPIGLQIPSAEVLAKEVLEDSKYYATPQEHHTGGNLHSTKSTEVHDELLAQIQSEDNSAQGKTHVEDSGEVKNVELLSSEQSIGCCTKPPEIQDDFGYLGRLKPKKPDVDISSLGDLISSDLYYIGDGVKLPLTIKKLKDGSFALSISDKICEQRLQEKCPCCVPREGRILQEKHSEKSTEGSTGNKDSSSLHRRAISDEEELEIEEEEVGDSKTLDDELHEEATRSGINVIKEAHDHSKRTARSISMPVDEFAEKYNLILNVDNLLSEDCEDLAAVGSPPNQNAIRRDEAIDGTRENGDLVQKMVSINDAPENQKADVLLSTLEKLISTEPTEVLGLVNRMKKKLQGINSAEDNGDGTKSGDKNARYGYQKNNPILNRIKIIKQLQNKANRCDHKYQKDCDDAITQKTELLKMILYWLKEMATSKPN